MLILNPYWGHGNTESGILLPKLFWPKPDYSVTFFGFFHMCDLGISFTFHFRKKLQNNPWYFYGMVFWSSNWKENKEACAICFEIRIPSKKKKELLQKVPSKIISYFILEKTKPFFGLSIIPNIITDKWGLDDNTP